MTRLWKVVHTTDPLLFDVVLDIESEQKATAITDDGMKLPLTSFKVEGQKITGSFKTFEPQDSIGLPTPPPKYDITFELKYIEDLLIGEIRVSPEISTAKVPGKLIILS